jgi:MFS transporter, putative metabolite:H+ symporter
MTSLESDAAQEAALIARVDRLGRWPYGITILIILGAGYFTAYFDISNVAFSLPGYAQAFHLSETTASNAISGSLYGYIAGSIVTGIIGERFGRKPAIFAAFTTFVVGSILSAVAFNYEWLLAWRVVTGMGIGGTIAAITTYIGEMAPARSRGRLTSIVTFFAFVGIGVVPLVAVDVAVIPSVGWRYMLLMGAVAGLVIPLIPRFLPESPRWLVTHGKIGQATRIVESAESRLGGTPGGNATSDSAAGQTASVSPGISERRTEAHAAGIIDVLRSRYAVRAVILFLAWTVQYFGAYTWLGLAPSLFLAKGYTLTESIQFLVVTAVGYPLGALFAVIAADRFDRRKTVAVGALATAAGAVMIALGATSSDVWIYLGDFIISVAFGLYLPIFYAITAESFPTQFRASGVALSDGGGHLGGALAPTVGAVLLAWGGIISGFTTVFLFIALCLVVTAAMTPMLVKGVGRTFAQVNPDVLMPGQADADEVVLRRQAGAS